MKKRILEAIAWTILVLVLLWLLDITFGIDVSKAPRLGG